MVNTDYPRITIVTPSFNQGAFLEETITSIIGQKYPNLEYFIVDGGSTDNSIEIIKKYERFIDWWVSEPDRGQSHAINKGFDRATGVYGNWINSDDKLEQDALRTIAEKIDFNHTRKVFIGEYFEHNESTGVKNKKKSDICTLEQLVDIKSGWRRKGGNQIGQQATFFPVQLFKDMGMLNEKNHNTMDYELWGKFLIAGAEFVHINHALGTFRIYKGQKISDWYKQTKSLMNAADRLIDSCPNWDYNKKKIFKRKVLKYKIQFYYGHLRSVIGIKRRLKNFLTYLPIEIK